MCVCWLRGHSVVVEKQDRMVPLRLCARVSRKFGEILNYLLRKSVYLLRKILVRLLGSVILLFPDWITTRLATPYEMACARDPNVCFNAHLSGPWLDVRDHPYFKANEFALYQ